MRFFMIPTSVGIQRYREWWHDLEKSIRVHFRPAIDTGHAVSHSMDMCMTNHPLRKAHDIGEQITRQIARSAQIFATVHANQARDRLPAHATLFYADGSDVSFDLPLCFGFNCIIHEILRKADSYPQPTGLVIIMPGMVLPEEPGHGQFMMYIETVETPGVVVHTPMDDMLSGNGPARSTPFKIYRSQVQFPTDILARILAANASEDEDDDRPLFQEREEPIYFSGAACNQHGRPN